MGFDPSATSSMSSCWSQLRPGRTGRQDHVNELPQQSPNGGWRRLNVGRTRARRKMQIFTSFDPGMIDLPRTIAEGVRDLTACIEFAHRGTDALSSADHGSQEGDDTPFEEAVTARTNGRAAPAGPGAQFRRGSPKVRWSKFWRA